MTIKTDNMQIGQNATATQNFVLKQGADGTFTLARGNVGATTQDVLTVDAAGKVTLTQGFPSVSGSALPSLIRLHTANGYGSTNTAIPRFTTVVTNQGSDITYADSATLGASFTINTNGVYSFSMSCISSVSGIEAGFSLNSTQLTTSVGSISAADRLTNASQVTNYNISCCTGGIYLTAGSVVRPHGSGASAGVYSAAWSCIAQRIS